MKEAKRKDERLSSDITEESVKDDKDSKDIDEKEVVNEGLLTESKEELRRRLVDIYKKTSLWSKHLESVGHWAEDVGHAILEKLAEHRRKCVSNMFQ